MREPKYVSAGNPAVTITGRNLSGLCDFNDDFLHMEGKFVEKVSVVNGWKVWLFVEGTSTSDILICDYFVREVRLLKPDYCVKHD